jgi:hypothetical protein
VATGAQTRSAAVAPTATRAVEAKPVVAPPAAAPASRLHADEALCPLLLGELRSAIRGKSLPELAEAARSDERTVQQACELLVARGQAVRRGLKYFQA